MPTCISYVVSAMEAVVLLLCNAGSVTHIARHLRPHTEPCVSFARANAKGKNNGVENILVSQQCSEHELQGKQKFKATGNTIDRYGEFRTIVVKTGTRRVGASGSLIIWNPGPENNVEPLQNDVL